MGQLGRSWGSHPGSGLPHVGGARAHHVWWHGATNGVPLLQSHLLRMPGPLGRHGTARPHHSLLLGLHKLLWLLSGRHGCPRGHTPGVLRARGHWPRDSPCRHHPVGVRHLPSDHPRVHGHIDICLRRRGHRRGWRQRLSPWRKTLGILLLLLPLFLFQKILQQKGLFL